MQDTAAWRAAYRHAPWRSEEERREFADYHVTRSRSSERMVVENHYGDWLFAK